MTEREIGRREGMREAARLAREAVARAQASGIEGAGEAVRWLEALAEDIEGEVADE